MNDEKLTHILYDIGFALMMVSMVIGPFEITNWALTTAVIACFLALAVISLAFQSWEDRDAEDDAEKNREEVSNK